MALIQAGFFSEALKRKVYIKAILPVNENTERGTVFPTLYLLHGLTENCEAWVSNTRIEKLAEEAGVAVGVPERGILFHEDAVFGNLDTASNTDKNPAYMLKQLKSGQIPRIYMACGTEDALIAANRNFKAHLEEAGAELTYVEAPGAHEWTFWDKQIEKAIKWFMR